jgi:hypothetical protein
MKTITPHKNHASKKRQLREDILLKNRRESSIKKWLHEHSIVALVSLSIIISLVMTGIGMWLYVSDGTARLDLSRPGFESERVNLQSDNTMTPYSTTGPLDRPAIDDFNNRFTTLKNQITNTSNYSEDVLSSQNLNLPSQSNDNPAN